ncbi:MAG: hypothetical protein WC606_01360 [Candidatus Absconditabacterales bacterium]
MTNATLDNILKDEVKVENGTLNQTDKNLLKNFEQTKLKAELDKVKIDGADIKDIVKAIGTNGESFSNGGWASTSLETKGVKVGEKTIKIGQNSEAMFLIQLFLQANGQKLTHYGADGWYGGESQGAAYRYYMEQKGGSTDTGTDTGARNIDIGDNMERLIKTTIDNLSYGDVKSHITPTMEKAFLWAAIKLVFNKDKKLQSKTPDSSGYYTIDQTKKTLTIHIVNNNKSLPSIQGKAYALDLTKFVNKKGEVDPAKYVPELYKAIDKMYNEEVLGGDLYQESANISLAYNAILTSNDTPLIKSEKINKLIVKLKALKTKAEGLKVAGGTTYDTFIGGRTAEINAYTTKSNEYIRLSATQSLTNLYKGNTTKEGDTTSARINFLKTESTELKRLKKFITASAKSYVGHEAESAKLLKAINDRLDKLPLEQAYITTKKSDLEDIAQLNKTPEGILKRGAVAQFKAEIKLDAHREAYTNYLGSAAGRAEFIKICGAYF